MHTFTSTVLFAQFPPCRTLVLVFHLITVYKQSQYTYIHICTYMCVDIIMIHLLISWTHPSLVVVQWCVSAHTWRAYVVRAHDAHRLPCGNVWPLMAISIYLITAITYNGYIKSHWGQTHALAQGQHDLISSSVPVCLGLDANWRAWLAVHLHTRVHTDSRHAADAEGLRGIYATVRDNWFWHRWPKH